jgi:hypothetical protein
MLTIVKIDLPVWTFQHKSGKTFSVKGHFSPDGEYQFEPEYGWGNLCSEVHQDVESLYENIDNLIYSAMPELYERQK